ALPLTAEAGGLEGAGIGAGIGAVVLGPFGAAGGAGIGYTGGGPNGVSRGDYRRGWHDYRGHRRWVWVLSHWFKPAEHWVYNLVLLLTDTRRHHGEGRVLDRTSPSHARSYAPFSAKLSVAACLARSEPPQPTTVGIGTVARADGSGRIVKNVQSERNPD